MNRATALLDWAMSQPSRDCIVTDDERYSFADVRDAVLAAASSLIDEVGPGTRVGLFIDSTPNFIVWEYAVFHLGGVVAPINRAQSQDEVRRLVDRLGIALVVSDSADLDLGPDVRVRRLQGELDVPSAADPAVPAAQLDVDAPALLLQTSGSTGEPKGVLLDQRNLIANYDATYRWIGVGNADRILLTLPIFNTYALNQGINMLAMSGATMRLLRRFSPEAVARAASEEDSTFLPLVPTMLTRMRQAGIVHDRPLKLGIGAAPSPTKIASDAWQVFPQAHLYMGYGLTEVTAIASLNHIGTHAEHHDDFASTGPIVSGLQMRIDQPSGEDQRGEILLQGDAVLRHYVGTDDPVPVVDGWLHTGDVGFVRDGRLTIVDRLRELIIRGGQNIYPGELERELTGHPAVLEAAVVPRAHDDFGEVPVAFVVARTGQDVTGEELREWVADRLAAFKVPAEVKVVTSMPKTPTGKIQKQVLRARA